MQNKNANEPYCEIENLIANNEDLIILTGNYRDFFGKLFYANKEKKINILIEKLALTFNNRLYCEIQRHEENLEKNYENFLLNLSSFNISCLNESNPIPPANHREGIIIEI